MLPITADDESQLGSARRLAMALAGTLDFDELHCGQLGIAVTEAARNLSAHGGGGEILLTPWRLGESKPEGRHTSAAYTVQTCSPRCGHAANAAHG